MERSRAIDRQRHPSLLDCHQQLAERWIVSQWSGPGIGAVRHRAVHGDHAVSTPAHPYEIRRVPELAGDRVVSIADGPPAAPDPAVPTRNPFAQAGRLGFPKMAGYLSTEAAVVEAVWQWDAQDLGPARLVLLHSYLHRSQR
jgi:hypothetical protein